jgi:hypothetical protein
VLTLRTHKQKNKKENNKLGLNSNKEEPPYSINLGPTEGPSELNYYERIEKYKYRHMGEVKNHGRDPEAIISLAAAITKQEALNPSLRNSFNFFH